MTRSLPVFAALLICAVSVPLSAVPPAVQAPAPFDGRPTFKEGSDRSYFVWRDGDKWHVRWTTMGTERVFTGTVRSTGGQLDDLKRIDVDSELKVIRPGRPARVVRGPAGRVRGVAPGRGPVVASKTEDHIQKVDDHLIRWTTRTDDDIDGFDFKAGDVRALTFDLKIQGQARPQSVEIGKSNRTPESNPFTVRLR
ncbi:MAG: hypothetical protein ABI051_12595 [Vicinamibacterales bacterium]